MTEPPVEAESNVRPCTATDQTAPSCPSMTSTHCSVLRSHLVGMRGTAPHRLRLGARVFGSGAGSGSGFGLSVVRSPPLEQAVVAAAVGVPLGQREAGRVAIVRKEARDLLAGGGGDERRSGGGLTVVGRRRPQRPAGPPSSTRARCRRSSSRRCAPQSPRWTRSDPSARPSCARTGPATPRSGPTAGGPRRSRPRARAAAWAPGRATAPGCPASAPRECASPAVPIPGLLTYSCVQVLPLTTAY